MTRDTDGETGRPTSGTSALTTTVGDVLRGHPVAVLALAASVGAVLGAVVLRGPATSGEALVMLVVAFVVGVASGRVWRSRWALLTVPAVLAIGFELARLPVSGPSVDLPRLASMFGWLALFGGRGLLALVVGLPVVLGVVVGRRGIARLARRRIPRGGDLGILVALLVVATLAVFVGRPARTAPIVGQDGAVVPNSVAELTRVRINGHDHAVMIRGHDVDNPVMLFLAGGPGGTELGTMRRHLPELERHVTVVTWDQRGTGRSYGALDPVDTYTLQSAVDDTIAMIEYVRGRFDEERIHLVGQSWGSTLGVLAVDQRPDLYHSWVGGRTDGQPDGHRPHRLAGHAGLGTQRGPRRTGSHPRAQRAAPLRRRREV